MTYEDVTPKSPTAEALIHIFSSLLAARPPILAECQEHPPVYNYCHPSPQSSPPRGEGVFFVLGEPVFNQAYLFVFILKNLQNLFQYTV